MWQKISLEGKELIDPYTKGRFSTCDFTFSNLYLWSMGEQMEYRIQDEVLELRGQYGGENFYFMPVPLSESPEAIEAMKNCIDRGLAEGRVYEGLPEEWKSYLEEDYVLEEHRDAFDYVYSVEELSNLKGRRFAKKKNKVNQFSRLYPNYRIERVGKENIEALKAFQREWCVEHSCAEKEVLRNESIGIMKLLDAFFDLDIEGLLLKDGEKIIGYSLGEALTKDYAVIHVEKALASYLGSYQILNMLFLQECFQDKLYVNREDDFGDPGLRKAKESYRPVHLLKKYELTAKK